ncbi:MAG: hypothetical protein K9W44_04705 [Candidatus Lokiarchaeota archaeon]|nr:hypothetical protein [Candidatus Harpocratesius repetitus]
MLWNKVDKFITSLPSLNRILEKKSLFSYIERPEMNIGQGDNKHSLFIGNNLEVLRYLLNQEIVKKYDLIFVDPPYNSHLDVIINDFSSKFPQIWYSGCSHLQWLKMMYLRLRLSLDLLHDNRGIIQICCDDKEYSYIRLLMDDLLGEHNFIGTHIWKSFSGAKSNTFFTQNHTYIIIYAKNRKKFHQFLNKSYTINPPESILDKFPTSIESRAELQHSLSNIITEPFLRYLNPKPVLLLEYLINTYAPNSEARILDLFSGTGTMFLAAIHNNLKKGLNVSVSGIQYPFSLKNFFRVDFTLSMKKNLHLSQLKHKTFIDLTLQRIFYEMKRNSWNNSSQIKVYKQILKPNKNSSQ